MASHMIADQLEFIDKNRATAGSVARSTKSVGSPANYADFASMDARLNAISATTYTQKVLDSMNRNDKIYALRMLDDPTTVG